MSGKPYLASTEGNVLGRLSTPHSGLSSGHYSRSVAVSWEPGCSCDAGDAVPCTVLDPFAGSGTTLKVAIKHRRHAIGVELNPAYVELIEKRMRGAQMALPLEGEEAG